MDDGVLLERVIELAAQLGIEVRREPLDGEGGGLCRIRGRPVLFIDTLADVGVRLDRCLEALAETPGVNDLYVRPDIRERLDQILGRDGG